MHLLGELLALVAVASLGIFFGAMLTEGLVLVPYWRSIAAEAVHGESLISSAFWNSPCTAPSGPQRSICR